MTPTPKRGSVQQTEPELANDLKRKDDLLSKICLDLFTADVEQYKTVDKEKKKRLKQLDLFVLDNSIRETTVGSLRGHTLDDKIAIFEEIKKCGFKNYVIEAFNNERRVGDKFLEILNAQGEDLSGAFAFCETWDAVEDEVPQELPIPIGMRKCKQFGVPNLIIELDLVYYKVDYTRFDASDICQLLKQRIDWIREHVSKDSMIFVNLRDVSDAIAKHPERVWEVVNFLSTLSTDDRIFGILIEDLGKYDQDHLGGMTKAIRGEMIRCGWEDGQLLVHVHEQWGLMHGIVLEMLAMGGTGIWAGICIEGAAMGHADTCTTIINLIRLGNKKVLKSFNCKYLRDAAIKVTKIVTTDKPYAKQPIYGERATDMVFGFLFNQISETDPVKMTDSEFDLVEFLGIKSEMRITTIASPEMILTKLRTVFGEDPNFTLECAQKMKATIVSNMSAGRKEEYNSQSGLAMLFDQAGGKITPKIAQTIVSANQNKLNIDRLIAEVKERWDFYDSKDGDEDDSVEFHHFYEGFMAPYFGCYRCEDSQAGLKALDMDLDGNISWEEFKYFLIWAGRQYPDVQNVTQLLDKTFRNGLIPAMMDELELMKRK